MMDEILIKCQPITSIISTKSIRSDSGLLVFSTLTSLRTVSRTTFRLWSDERGY